MQSLNFLFIEVIALAILVGITCTLSGIFLVLQGKSLTSDAISHSILLGIVIGFMLTEDLSSPLLIIGATLIGILSVTLSEIVLKTKLIKEDASIGLIFPFLFSIAIIIINLFFKNVHIDTDSVITGELIYAPFRRFYLFGFDLGPLSFWVMMGIFFLNIIFLVVFFKELKIITFDPIYATLLGFSPMIINYLQLFVVSITLVGSFDSVGSILVVAFMITPVATSFLLTNQMDELIGYSLIISIVSTIIGFIIAFNFDYSIAGCISLVLGIIFISVCIFSPKKGILSQLRINATFKTP